MTTNLVERGFAPTVLATTLSADIFNTEKNDYEKPAIIFGEKAGLFDTINKSYPDLWKYYKTLKSLDWDEVEFDYSICNLQFKTCSPAIYSKMIKNLTWQWEGDSIAARAITSILGPVCTSSEAWAGWSRIGDNENLHAATYSEIIRGSFDNPDEIIKEILAIQESMERVGTISKVFERAHITSHQYALGQIPNDQAAFNSIFMFLVALFCMERIQFMASFSVTFAIVDATGLFQPIGKAVQKIAQDEFEIHVQYGMAVLRHLAKTERGQIALKEKRNEILELLNEVREGEIKWLLFAMEDSEGTGSVTLEMFIQWINFLTALAYDFFGMKDQINFEVPESNPLPFIENWLDISKMQSAPQEEDNNQYKVGVVIRDDNDVIFE